MPIETYLVKLISSFRITTDQNAQLFAVAQLKSYAENIIIHPTLNRRWANPSIQKCRKKVETKNPKSITMKNKRPAIQGESPRCGTKLFRIGKS